jgi:hypothetical protein
MQQNIFIPCAQKSTQLAVCNLFRLKFVHKILILGGLEEQLELSTQRRKNKFIFSITVIFGCILTCGKWCCQFVYPNITRYRRRVWYNLFFGLIPTLCNNGVVWNLEIIYAQHQIRLDITWMTKMLYKLKLGTQGLFGCTIWRSPERLPHTTASEQPIT